MLMETNELIGSEAMRPNSQPDVNDIGFFGAIGTKWTQNSLTDLGLNRSESSSYIDTIQAFDPDIELNVAGHKGLNEANYKLLDQMWDEGYFSMNEEGVISGTEKYNSRGILQNKYMPSDMNVAAVYKLRNKGVSPDKLHELALGKAKQNWIDNERDLRYYDADNLPGMSGLSSFIADLGTWIADPVNATGLGVEIGAFKFLGKTLLKEGRGFSDDFIEALSVKGIKNRRYKDGNRVYENMTDFLSSKSTKYIKGLSTKEKQDGLTKFLLGISKQPKTTKGKLKEVLSRKPKEATTVQRPNNMDREGRLQNMLSSHDGKRMIDKMANKIGLKSKDMDELLGDFHPSEMLDVFFSKILKKAKDKDSDMSDSLRKFVKDKQFKEKMYEFGAISGVAGFMGGVTEFLHQEGTFGWKSQVLDGDGVPKYSEEDKNRDIGLSAAFGGAFGGTFNIASNLLRKETSGVGVGVGSEVIDEIDVLKISSDIEDSIPVGGVQEVDEFQPTVLDANEIKSHDETINDENFMNSLSSEEAKEMKAQSKNEADWAAVEACFGLK